MLITLHDVEYCGVQSPNAPISIGIKRDQKGFYFDNLIWMNQRAAMESYRHRVDHPQHPDELCLLLETPKGYRICIHHAGVKMFPYEDALVALCDQMRSSGKLPISNNRWGIRVFKTSFIASEAVTWLVDHLQVTREEAVQIGQLAQKQGCIDHVLGEQTFMDDYLFFRFTQDGDPQGRLVGSSGAK